MRWSIERLCARHVRRHLSIAFEFCATAGLCAVALAVLPLTADAQLTTTGPATAAAANVVKYRPNLSTAKLAGRPDSDMVEFDNGRRVRLGDVRRLEASISKARATRAPNVLPALRQRPAATGTAIRNASDLAAALKRSDQETVVLPSGQRATVAQLRIAKTFADKRMARSPANAPQRPNLSGVAIKVTPETDFKALLTKPDATVLETPQGTRVTVGEIKQYFAQRAKTPAQR